MGEAMPPTRWRNVWHGLGTAGHRAPGAHERPWAVLLYLCGAVRRDARARLRFDEQLTELAAVGSGSNMHVAVGIDGPDGARRVVLADTPARPGQAVQFRGSDALAPANSGDEGTLGDFIDWANSSAPPHDTRSSWPDSACSTLTPSRAAAPATCRTHSRAAMTAGRTTHCRCTNSATCCTTSTPCDLGDWRCLGSTCRLCCSWRSLTSCVRSASATEVE
jgi:hypothetical protein